MKGVQGWSFAVMLIILSGCSTMVPKTDLKTSVPTQASSENAAIVPPAAAENNVVIQKIEFRSGVSSAAVERLAKRFGCTGGAGAGLITEKGPVEVYRMRCDDGTTFMARCELRQCTPMR